MKVGVVGGRLFADDGHYVLMKQVLDRFKKIDLIVSGGARGADSLGERYASEMGIETQIHHPDWEEFGKRAGIIRNGDIVRDSDLVVAFWDKSSRGTRNTISRCHKTSTPIMIVYY